MGYSSVFNVARVRLVSGLRKQSWVILLNSNNPFMGSCWDKQKVLMGDKPWVILLPMNKDLGGWQVKANIWACEHLASLFGHSS